MSFCATTLLQNKKQNFESQLAFFHFGIDEIGPKHFRAVDDV
jgi:hypothetical protein